jgi:DNA-binding beta-propeller fold protein YncE
MRLIRLAVALVFCGLVVVPLRGAASTEYYSISRDDNLLRTIDPVDGSTIGVPVSISFPAATVSGGNGLATDPLTGDLYALLRIQTGFPPNRWLVIIDPATGVSTVIGNTGARLAGLAFDSVGTLYTVTGDGEPVLGLGPETLYTLSLIDATPTFVTALGNGTGGEAIGFNPDDGFLYHASGLINDPDFGDTRIFEKINLNTLVVTNIPLSGPDYTEMTALVFSGSSFFGADTGFGFPTPVLLSLTDTGVTSIIGSTDHVVKGLPEPSSSLMLVAGAGFLAGLYRWGKRAG